MSPYPGLSPDLVVSHFPFASSEPAVVLELNSGGPLWTAALLEPLPSARFLVFAKDAAAEEAARAAVPGDRVRFLRADWRSGAWETKLPAGFHAALVPFVAAGETDTDQQILIGRLSGKLREGGMLFWGGEVRAALPEQEADYERRLRDYRARAGLALPVPEASSGGVRRPKWEQLRRWIESASLSNVDLLWKQELAAVITAMKRV